MHGDTFVDVLVASVDAQQVAFHLTDVDEVLPAAEAAPLPHAPEVIRGLLNLRGEPLPLLDLRTRLGLPGREAHPDDHVLVCRVAGRRIGVWVDRADDVRRLEDGEVRSVPDSTARHFAGAAMVEDGVLLVSDVASFLSLEEAADLEQALVPLSEAGTDV